MKSGLSGNEIGVIQTGATAQFDDLTAQLDRSLRG
jgi:hypothetical protein